MAAPLTPAKYNLMTGFFIAGMAAAMIGCFAIGGQWVAVAGVSFGLLTTLTLLSYHATAAKSLLKRHGESHEHSPNLGKTIRELCAAAGKDYGKLPVLDLNVSEEAFAQLPERRKKSARRHALSAMSSYAEGDVVIISDPMLKLLDDPEEKAIIGLEFAHMLCHHGRLGQLRKGMMDIITFTVLGVMVMITWDMMGWDGTFAALGAMAAAIAGVKFGHKDGNKLFANDESALSPADLVARDKARSFAGLLVFVAWVAVLMVFSSKLALAMFIGANVLWLVAMLFNNAAGRVSEYQADEGTVALGASPLALITALRKIQMLNERSKQKFMAATAQPQEQAGGFSRCWQEMSHSHPPTEKRIARAAALAKKKGIAEEDIKRAVVGEIKLAEDHIQDLPYDVMRQLMKRL